MPEGLVYVCSWKKTEEGFEIWVKRRPKINAVGETFDDARESLAEEVCLALGDGEAAFEFDPPAPQDCAVSSGVPPLVVVGANSRPDGMRGATEEMCQALYSGGLCPVCCAGLGERTASPWFVEIFESGFEAAFWIGEIGDRMFFPEAFISALSGSEAAQFTWQPVKRSRGRKKFLELIANSPVPKVAVKGLEACGSYCPECNYRRFYPNPVTPGQPAVCEDDLPSPLPSCFAIGDARETDLCMTLERWQQLRGKRETKGCVTTPLIVVPKASVDCEPELRRLTEAPGNYKNILARYMVRKRIEYL